jgi:hypothetical protein
MEPVVVLMGLGATRSDCGARHFEWMRSGYACGRDFSRDMAR